MPETFHNYLRKSTEDKQPNTIQIQRQWGQDLCQQKGWTYGAEYVDEGQKSWVLNRPMLKRLVQDIVAGQVKRVGSHNHDRLARGSIMYTLLDLFDAYQVKSTFGDLPDTVGEAGSMIKGFLVGYDQYFLDKLHSRTKEALQHKMKQGVRVGRPILGFKWDKGHLTPEPWVEEMVNDLSTASPLEVAQQGKYPAKSSRAIRRVRQYFEAYQEGGQQALKAEIAVSTRRSYDGINKVAQRKADEEQAFRIWLAEHTPIKPVVR